MASAIKLHIGCGNKHWPGFTNLDSETDLLNLKHNYGEVAEIHAIHLFEHFSRSESPYYLKAWHRSLAPGGLLVLEMPCLDKILARFATGEKNLRMTMYGLYGDPTDERPLMGHQWCYSEREITGLLSKNFNQVKVQEPVFHQPQRDMRVTARKE